MKEAYLGSLQIHDNEDNTLGYALKIPIDGLSLPSIRLATYDKPGEHGLVLANQLYGGRNIELQGIVQAETLSTYELRRRALQNVCRIVKDEYSVPQPILFKFTTMDDLQLQAEVYARNLPLLVENLLKADFLLSLVAPDPNLYDQSQQLASFTVPVGGGAIYPVVYPVVYDPSSGGMSTVNNGGNAETYPILTFNGPLTSPYFENTTTGETFRLNYDLATGSQIIADMKKKTIVLNSNTNMMSVLDEGSVWMQLAPGDNNIRFNTASASNTGTASIAYRSAYIGV